MPDQTQLVKLGVVAAVLFVAYKYGNDAVKAMALGVAGVVIAKNTPYVQDVLA
jgi:hypothetical protein